MKLEKVEKQTQIRKSDNYSSRAISLIYKLRAITVRSDNGF